MTDDEIRDLLNHGLNMLHLKLQDDLAVLRNSGMVSKVLLNQLLALHPNPVELWANLHRDLEQAIADVLTRGYPEWIVQRHQTEIEETQAYLAGLAQIFAQGARPGSSESPPKDVP
jgi:hypothetical protein